jgi:NADH-quinone oxidoreductase subunit K
MTALQSLVTVLAQAQPATTADSGSVGLTHYLVVSAIVFSLGIMIIITRRNAIALLMGLELLLNSAALNFVAFGKFMTPGKVDGQIVALFLIVIAAAELLSRWR